MQKNSGKRKKTNNHFNSEASYDFHILYKLLFYTCRAQQKTKKQRLATFTDHAYLSAEMRLICFFMQMQKKRQRAFNPIISVFLLQRKYA